MLTKLHRCYAKEFFGSPNVQVWAALELEGLGANLQHYDPLIDEKVAAAWNIPVDWSLKGQLVFGKPVGAPAEKTFRPLDERVFVYGYEK